MFEVLSKDCIINFGVHLCDFLSLSLRFMNWMFFMLHIVKSWCRMEVQVGVGFWLILLVLQAHLCCSGRIHFMDEGTISPQMTYSLCLRVCFRVIESFKFKLQIWMCAQMFQYFGVSRKTFECVLKCLSLSRLNVECWMLQVKSTMVGRIAQLCPKTTRTI